MPGNLDFEDMLPLDAFLHMMPPEQITLVLEVTQQEIRHKGEERVDPPGIAPVDWCMYSDFEHKFLR